MNQVNQVTRLNQMNQVTQPNQVTQLNQTGIYISSRQVVWDDYKVLRTSIKNYKLVWRTSKF